MEKESSTENNANENMIAIKHCKADDSSDNICKTNSVHTNSANRSGVTDVSKSDSDEIEKVSLSDVSQNNPNKSSPTKARIGHTSEDKLGSHQPDTLACGSQKNVEAIVMSPKHVDDGEIIRRAKEGRVNVVFPGCITQDGCCRFVCELLKCVLYQRQQLPMMYEQMVFLQKQQCNSAQAEGAMDFFPVKTSDSLDWRRCQRTLQELDEVLLHLESLFSLSKVPRVLFMLGGSSILPNELYEVNLEKIAVGTGDGSLRTSVCLRQLFRTLFVADLLSDAKSVRIMTTTIIALGHRDCGVTGFRPKLDFKVPTKVRRQVISLASDLSPAGELQKCEELDDYIWFQVPVTVKGFCK